MAEYDVVIMGSGPAGEKAGAQAAYFGYRVAIVEKERAPGGTIANTLSEAFKYAAYDGLGRLAMRRNSNGNG